MQFKRDLAYTGFQLCMKGALACLGWYNILTFPEIFDHHGQIKIIQMPYATVTTCMFFICNCVDIHWHWNGNIMDIIHHVLGLLGTILCCGISGFGINIIAITSILETVAPIYQLLKLHTYSICIKKNKNFLRMIAIGINFFVRIPYCFWLGNVLIVQINVHNKGLDPYLQINPFVCYMCLFNCLICIILDLIWSRNMLFAICNNKTHNR